MSVSKKGKLLSTAHKANIGNTIMGKKHSAERNAKKSAAQKKAVVMTILETGSEFLFESSLDASKEMCVSNSTISKLATKKAEKSKSKGGKYKDAFFTARYR